MKPLSGVIFAAQINETSSSHIISSAMRRVDGAVVGARLWD